MSKNEIAKNEFSNVAIENYILNLDAELNDFATLQGKEDAQKASLLTESLFKIKVIEFVQPKIQRAIDFIMSALLVTSKVFEASVFDQDAQKRIQILNNEINDRLHLKASLKRKLAGTIVNHFKRKYSKWLIVIALLVGAGDAALAFGSFRYGGYTMLQALLTSIAIGAVISASHLIYGNWINQTQLKIVKTLKIFFVLGIAFAFFAWIGKLRAEALNNILNIDLDRINVAAISSYHLNGLAIAIISFVLFSSVFFLSLVLWKSKEERLQIEEFNKLNNQISAIDIEIKALEQEIIATEINTANQKNEARRIFDYSVNSIRKCKSVGRSAITRYKQIYARFHNDIVPEFFAASNDLTYDETFRFPKTQKMENA